MCSVATGVLVDGLIFAQNIQSALVVVRGTLVRGEVFYPLALA